jgi:hypothetical protein
MKNGSAAKIEVEILVYPPLLGDVPPSTDSSKDKEGCEWNRMEKRYKNKYLNLTLLMNNKVAG